MSADAAPALQTVTREDAVDVVFGDHSLMTHLTVRHGRLRFNRTREDIVNLVMHRGTFTAVDISLTVAEARQWTAEILRGVGAATDGFDPIAALDARWREHASRSERDAQDYEDMGDHVGAAAHRQAAEDVRELLADVRKVFGS